MMIVAMATMFFAPFLMGILHLLIFLALFIVWLVCVLQAMNGKRFKLPIIGALAEKQAGI
jgi:uncharacterized membrane protein